jgi:hypothetical protein
MNNNYNDFVKNLPNLSLVTKNTFGKKIRTKRIFSHAEKDVVKIVEKGNIH